MCNLSEDVWEKGMKNGIEKGMEKGMEQGAKTEREKIIFNMHQNGFTLDQIAGATGVSSDEVKSVISRKKPALA
jgi:predicted transposase/invertase (TIGR01784 family)